MPTTAGKRRAKLKTVVKKGGKSTRGLYKAVNTTVNKEKKQRSKYRKVAYKKHGKGKNQRNKRIAMIDVLTAPNYYSKEWSADCVGNASTVAEGIDPAYIIGGTTDRTNSATVVNQNCSTTTNIEDVCLIANQIVLTEALLSPGSLNNRFILKEAKSTYTFTSACNVMLQVEHYCCTFREDIPHTSTNIFTLVNAGWLEGGIQDGSSRLEITPFNSVSFCEQAKIDRVIKYKLEPGKIHTVVLLDNKERRINPGKYIAPTDETTTYITAPLTYAFIKGSKFLITRFWSAPSTTSTGGGANSVPSYTAGELMMNISTRITYKHLEDERTNIFCTSQIGINQPGATPQSVNPLTGVIQATAQL